MKRIIFSLLLIGLLATACAPSSDVGSTIPPYIDTGVDSSDWATIPAGEFPYGQHDHMTEVDEYQIMITDVTVEQYTGFLNEALASGDVSVGDFKVEAGELVWHEEGAGGYYIHNDKGVVLELKTHADGVALSIGVQGMTFQLVDEK